MSWLPSFINPAAAGIAAAIAIPSLLLLYFLKLRRKELPIASTLLWKKSVQDLQVNAPFQRLRRSLLLFLQLAILLALLLAFSRPVSFQPVGAAQQNVIAIDRSASMATRDVDGRTRLEQAKQRADELVDSLPRGGRAAIVAFDSSAQVVQQMTADKAALHNAIALISQTEQRTRMAMAYQLADAAISLNPEDMIGGKAPVPDLFVLSDGRASDTDGLSFTGTVHYERMGSDAAKNIGIVALSAQRNYERPNEVTVFARLANFGPEPASADLELSVAPIDRNDPSAEDFERRQIKESAVLLPERYTAEQRQAAGVTARDSVAFQLDLTDAAIIRVEAKTREGDDALAIDNRAHVVVPAPRTQSIAVVTSGNVCIELAVNALQRERTKYLTPTDYEASLPTDYDVIVFDRYNPKQLPATGNFLYFGCLPPGVPLKQATNEAGVGLVETEPRVLDWQRDHPLVRGLNLSRIQIAESLRLDVPPEAQTIVEGTTAPLVVLYRQQRQTHLVCAFDVLQSDWPFRPTYQIFFVNAMQFLALGSEMDVREAYAPGDVPRIPRTNLARAAAITAGEMMLIGPTQRQSVRVPETGDFALPALREVGLYRTEPSVPEYEWIAVNLLDPNESNVLPLASAPGGVGTLVNGEAGSGGNKARVEWWWWLVAAVALPMLLVEWWVYARNVKV